MNKFVIVIKFFFSFSYYRTAEDVRDMIKFAKLHESEITPLSQILSFPPEQSSFNNLHLLQLDRELLENIAVGDTVVFKGLL